MTSKLLATLASVLIAFSLSAAESKEEKKPEQKKVEEKIPLDKLPEVYGKVIGQADSGSVAPVFTLPGDGGRQQFVVLKVTSRRPEGDIRYEDVQDRIRQQLGQQLAIRRYLDRLRASTYVEIRS